MNIVFWLIVLSILALIWLIMSKAFFDVGNGIDIIIQWLKEQFNRKE